MKLTLTMGVVAMVAALAGCFSAEPPDGVIVCGPVARPCPEGYHCASDHTCRRGGTPTQDLGTSMLVVSPSSQDFGKVAIGKSASLGFVFTNSGQASTGALTTTTSGDAAFTLASDGCHGQTLAAGASCTIMVGFAPTSAGMDSFMLAVSGTPGGTAMATATGEGGDFVTLTVTTSAASGSSGSVSGSGIDCGATCTAAYASGSTVTLTAAPDLSSRFDSWSGVTCQDLPTTGVCSFTITADTTLNAAFTSRPKANFAFVTSTTVVPGMLGANGADPLAAADAVCSTAAIRGGLPGTYRALLSTSTVSASSRLGTASGWVRSDGLVFAQSSVELWQGKIRYPLIDDETGKPISATFYGSAAVTGTDKTGVTLSGQNSCNDYTSTAGSVNAGIPSAGTEAWVNIAEGPACGNAYHLYCFETTSSAGAPLPSPGTVRLAFVTQNQHVLPLTSLAAADTVCQGEGSKLSSTATWKALLATTTASAASRFNTSGAPWARPDGVLLASTAAGLFTDNILAAFNVDSMGNYIGYASSENNTVATGADNGTTAIGVNTCGNWTSTTGNALAGRVNFSTVSWYLGAAAYCSGSGDATMASITARLYCLQQ